MHSDKITASYIMGIYIYKRIVLPLVLLLSLFLYSTASAENTYALYRDSGNTYKLSCSDSVVFSVSSDQGTSFSRSRYLASAESGTVYSAPSIFKIKTGISAIWNMKNSLYISKSFDQGSSWSTPSALFVFPERPLEIRTAASGDNIQIFWSSASGKIYNYSNFIGIGDPNGPGLVCAMEGVRLFAAWKGKAPGDIISATSPDNGKTWPSISAVNDPGSRRSEIKALAMNGGTYISWRSSGSGTDKIMFSSSEICSMPEISAIDLVQGKDGAMVVFFSSGASLYSIASFDGGKTWTKPLSYPGTANDLKGFSALLNASGGAALYSMSGRIVNITAPIPKTPETGIKGEIATGTGKIEVSLNRPVDGDVTGPFLEISKKNDFSNKLVFPFENGKAAVEIPASLGEGTYFCRAVSSNGLNSTYSSVQKIVFDKTSPIIVLSSGTGTITTSSNEATLSGSTEISATITVNGSYTNVGRDGRFDARIPLKKGLNNILLEAKDPAGNTSSLTLAFDYIPQSPVITIKRPSGTDWLRDGAMAAIEAAVEDPQDDIEDETEASAYINSVTAESSLIYDKNEKKITGFITIPKNTLNGENSLIIKIADIKKNIGVLSTKINVDSKAPQIDLVLSENSFYSNRKDQVIVPLKDEGAGPDLQNSSIKLMYGGATVEGKASFDRASNALLYITARPMENNRYQVEVTPRDLIGNTGKAAVLTLIIDTVPPKLDLLNDIDKNPSSSTITIKGSVDKPSVTKVSVKNNSGKPSTFPVSNNIFSADITLQNGQNDLLIEAADAAGNTASIKSSVYFSAPPDEAYFNFDGKNITNGDFVKVSAAIKVLDPGGGGITGGTVKIDGTAAAYNDSTGDVSSGTLSTGAHEIALELPGKTYSVSFNVDPSLKIGSVAPCPNPFDPALGNACITYNLSQSGTVFAYIFDMNGSLVWKSDIAGQTGYNKDLFWNGRSADGQIVSNGLYILKLVARNSAGETSSGKSKIIVLR